MSRQMTLLLVMACLMLGMALHGAEAAGNKAAEPVDHPTGEHPTAASSGAGKPTPIVLKPAGAWDGLRSLVVMSRGRQKPLSTHARETITDIFQDQALPQDAGFFELYLSLLFQHERWLEEACLDVGLDALSERMYNGKKQVSPKDFETRFRMLQSLLGEVQAGLKGDETGLPKDKEALTQLQDAIYNLYGRVTRLYDLPEDFRCFPDPEAGEVTWLNIMEASKAVKTGRTVFQEGLNSFQALSGGYAGGDEQASAENASRLLSLQRALADSTDAAVKTPEHAILSEGLISLEHLYYAVDFRWVGLVLFSLALAGFIAGFACPVCGKAAVKSALALLALGTLWIFWVVAARTAIAGRLPLKNLQEVYIVVLFFLPLIGILLAYLMKQPLYHLLSCALMVIGFIGALKIPEEGYRISPLVAILHSPWREVHILTIMLSYAILLVALGLHITFLCVVLFKKQARRRENGKVRYSELALDLDRKAYLLVAWGFFFLTAGIATGAAWGQYAWGRYWGWDPKEVWASVAWAIYALFLHLRLFYRAPREVLAVVNIIGYAAILFTYFGVTYLLSGLHAYS